MDRLHPAMKATGEFSADELEDPAVQGLIAMKYDPDDVIHQASSYKEEGNRYLGLNRTSMAISSYSAGLAVNCGDEKLNAQLLFNRGIANFRVKNFRSALKDFESATHRDKSYVKAFAKAADCCFQLQRFDDGLQWCEGGLALDASNKVILDLQNSCTTARDRRKAEDQRRSAEKARVDMENNLLMSALKTHGVRFHPATVFTLEWFKERSGHGRVPFMLGEKGGFSWPVLLSYPELKSQDLIETFDENTTFFEQLAVIFSQQHYGPDYSAGNVCVGYELETTAIRKLVILSDSKVTLISVMRRPDFVVCNGTAHFLVLPKKVGGKWKSGFLDDFFRNYDKIDEF